jgi:hypothetical protein
MHVQWRLLDQEEASGGLGRGRNRSPEFNLGLAGARRGWRSQADPGVVPGSTGQEEVGGTESRR